MDQRYKIFKSKNDICVMCQKYHGSVLDAI